MKTRFPVIVTHNGVVAKIHQSFQIQKGKKYDDFLVIYQEGFTRKRLWHSTQEAAQIAAKDACGRIANGEHLSHRIKEGTAANVFAHRRTMQRPRREFG